MTPLAFTCHCCDKPIPVGQERRFTVEQGSGASPVVIVHRKPCRPKNVRRHL